MNLPIKIVRTNKKKKKKQPEIFKEYGKRMTTALLIFFGINVELIIIASFILMYLVGDVAPLSELLIGVFAVLGTVATAAVGFYQWKTKAINIVRMKKELGLKINEDDIKENGNIGNDESVG